MTEHTKIEVLKARLVLAEVNFAEITKQINYLTALIAEEENKK